MKVTGFTFIKNAVKFDYPIVEAINSILPICDDFVVAVGQSEDDTLNLIKSINPNKIKAIETIWDENLRSGGRVLAAETNKALKHIPSNSDWCFYIQGDEIVHEKYLDKIKDALERYKDDDRIDGLLFNYLHFYGSYDYVGAASHWYPNEIRIIKNDRSIYSFRDAQGFRKGDNKKLRVYPIDAYIYHYGWVRIPEAMQQKQEHFHKLYHDDKWIEENVVSAEAYDYEEKVKVLEKFTGTHPAVIKDRIEKMNWKFDHDISMNRKSFKDKTKEFLLKLGINTYYHNYILKKPLRNKK